MKRYLAWRCSDCQRPTVRDTTLNGKQQFVYQRGQCETCNQPVWVNPANLDNGITLVCWPCGEST